MGLFIGGRPRPSCRARFRRGRGFLLVIPFTRRGTLQVADPSRLTRADANGVLEDGPVRFVGCYLSGLLALSPIAEETMRDWMNSK